MRQSQTKTISRLIQAGLALLSATTLVLFGVLAAGLGLDASLWPGLRAIGPDRGGPVITVPGGQQQETPGEQTIGGIPNEGAPPVAAEVPDTASVAGRPATAIGTDRDADLDRTIVAVLDGPEPPGALPSDPDRGNTDFEPPQIDDPDVIPNPSGPGRPAPPADDDAADTPPGKGAGPGGQKPEKANGKPGKGKPGKPGKGKPGGSEPKEPGKAGKGEPGSDTSESDEEATKGSKPDKPKGKPDAPGKEAGGAGKSGGDEGKDKPGKESQPDKGPDTSPEEEDEPVAEGGAGGDEGGGPGNSEDAPGKAKGKDKP
jgi:hypothetical protein